MHLCVQCDRSGPLNLFWAARMVAYRRRVGTDPSFAIWSVCGFSLLCVELYSRKLSCAKVIWARPIDWDRFRRLWEPWAASTARGRARRVGTDSSPLKGLRWRPLCNPSSVDAWIAVLGTLAAAGSRWGCTAASCHLRHFSLALHVFNAIRSVTGGGSPACIPIENQHAG